MKASMNPFGVEDLETYIIEDTSTSKSFDVLLDSAIIHTILQDILFFIKIIFQHSKLEI